MNREREQILENTVQLCRDRHVIIPTYKQMRNPELIPEKIKSKLRDLGLWELNTLNLFRISWKNEPVEFGGGFSDVNYIELPPELTGVKARIVVLIGKYFPTGAHKVGATFGPLVEKLITGRFDPTRQKALWPSTGNYCRGGAYDSYLLGCKSVAVLPEGMSSERFEWLEKVGAEIFATPGCESNVKEIYDKVKELEAERGDEIVTLNQFNELGNPRWHYAVTGPAMQEVYSKLAGPKSTFSGIFLTQGSTGTLGSAEFIREIHPHVKVCAGEALQCPTMLYNGFGGHRIEGIGDKHIPWIFNLRNIDMAAAIDDHHNIHIMRLFNESEGKKYLTGKLKIDPELVEKLHLLGISGIANMMGCIKMAKYYEMDENDILFTVATDSMEMYQSRMREEQEKYGSYNELNAAVDHEASLMGIQTDHLLELSYHDKKRIHNLKYFTWIEQQGKPVEELNAQWYDKEYWTNAWKQVDEWDEKIDAFNRRTGVINEYQN